MTAERARHVGSVKAIYAAFRRGDVDEVLLRLRPDVRWEHSWQVEPPESHRPRKGRDDVRDFFGALRAFEMLRFEPLDFLSSASRVAVPIAIEMRSRVTGRTLSDVELHLWEFAEDGLVARHRAYIDSFAFHCLGTS